MFNEHRISLQIMLLPHQECNPMKIVIGIILFGERLSMYISLNDVEEQLLPEFSTIHKYKCHIS